MDVARRPDQDIQLEPVRPVAKVPILLQLPLSVTAAFPRAVWAFYDW
jgi:hypothetical protein